MMHPNFEYRTKRGTIDRTDHKQIRNQLMRKRMIDKAKADINKEDKYHTATSAESRATDTVVDTSTNTSLEGVYQSKRLIHKTARKVYNHRVEASKSTDNHSTQDIHHTVIKSPYTQSHRQSATETTHTSNSKAKQSFVGSIKRHTREISNNVVRTVKEKLEKAGEYIIKKATTGIIKYVIAGALGLLLIIPVMIAPITGLARNTMIIPAQMMLSDEVLAYEETITRYARQYGIEDYVPIIEAIMMQESKGLGNDPMQASECPFNTRFPGGITDPEYSIKVGIKYYADCISRSNVADVNDDAGISLSLQGYNYGNGYIEWALTNFNGYTAANAKVFSDMKKEQLHVDTYGDPDYVEHVLRYVCIGFGNIRGNPNFDNAAAWVSLNPYARAGLYGQCTWFAWGRFYEIYGYSPGFTGDGWKCVDQLVATHPDKFKKSSTPTVGAVFSTLGHNHVGIVIGWDGSNITIQDGNLDGRTNTFTEAKRDWRTKTMPLSTFISSNGGVVFGVPK